jgi:transposase
VWARGLGRERVWALGDCRHVSGSFERFVIARGGRVLRVATKLVADSRRRARGRGKSDSIDAIAVARAALREGVDALPAARPEGPELDLRLLVDHRERLVGRRVAPNNTLQWPLHDLRPELRVPGSPPFCGNRGPRVARRLARTEQTMRVADRPRRATPHPRALADHRGARGTDRRPGRPGRAAAAVRARLRAADRGQARRRDRRRGQLRRRAKLARAAAVAPIPVSPGKTNRHRLDRGGNRQINTAIHRIAVTRLRCHPETQDHIARKRAEGKTTKQAIRRLKRHLTRRPWHPLQTSGPAPSQTITPSIS